MDSKPALNRTNAIRNGKYRANKPQRGFDLDVGYTSFRIHGDSEGEIDFLYAALDISGPGDFCLSPSDWDAAMKLDPDLATPFAKSTHSDGSAINEGGIIQRNEQTLIQILPSSSEIPKITPPLLKLPSPKERKIGQGKRSKEEVVESSKENEELSNGGAMAIAISPHAGTKRTIHIHKWMIGESLGRGSFGTVYSAINHDGFFFAIKEIFIDQGINAKQAMIPLEQEVSLLSRLQHENIVQYYGTEQKEGKLYIFLELVTQGSLASLYRKYQLQDSQVSAYTRQILYGLNYLHQRNVLHRDIKCANILVDSSGCVKLADFGLAKEIDILIQAKSCKGSVYWMAPEVAKSRPYGPSADIWSLGCTVLEMLTGKLPYPDTEWMPALFKIGRGERPPIPATLSEDARDFIDKCLQVNAGNRPSAVDLLKHPFLKRSLPDDHSA
ncbi:hypothetical protein LUZ60_001309 [Juncus effusus]|nr:hypothetical protein LUZ60_001309 [Juncus effusus]